MSFILDALRRADRERESERGGVPSLYTQAAPLPTAPAPPADGSAPRPWLWLAAGLGGGLVLAAVWALWSATPASTAPVAAVPDVGAPPPRTALPAPAPAPEAPRAEAVTPAPPPAETRPPPTQAAAKPPAESPRPTPAPVTRADAKPPVTKTAPATPPAAERPAVARQDAPRAPAARVEETPAPSAERAAGTPIRQLGELSAEVRNALPKLTIGGAMYSANASSRRLIVNGQLLSEGEAVAPGVTIEEIRLKSAVLRTKDLRYELGF